jgi:hypothetical protein
MSSKFKLAKVQGRSPQKKEASIIGESSGKKCVGGKGLAGNSLEIKKRQIVMAMARFVYEILYADFRKCLVIKGRKILGCEHHRLSRL